MDGIHRLVSSALGPVVIVVGVGLEIASTVRIAETESYCSADMALSIILLVYGTFFLIITWILGVQTEGSKVVVRNSMYFMNIVYALDIIFATFCFDKQSQYYSYFGGAMIAFGCYLQWGSRYVKCDKRDEEAPINR